MRVVKNTAERLELRGSAWMMGIIVGAFLAVFIAVALRALLSGDLKQAALLGLVAVMLAVVGAVFVRHESAIFDGPAGQVSIGSVSVLGRRKTIRPLAGLKGARLEARPAEKAFDKPAERVLLEWSDGSRLPVSALFKSGRVAGDASRAINEWLAIRKR